MRPAAAGQSRPAQDTPAQSPRSVSDQDLLRGLERATFRVGATTNDDDLFALILEAAADIGYSSASLMVYDRAHDALVVRASKGADLLGTKLAVSPAVSWRGIE